MTRRNFLGVMAGGAALGTGVLVPESAEAQGMSERINVEIQRALIDEYGLPEEMLEPMMRRLRYQLTRAQERIISATIPRVSTATVQVTLEIDGSTRYQGQSIESLLNAEVQRRIQMGSVTMK